MWNSQAAFEWKLVPFSMYIYQNASCLSEVCTQIWHFKYNVTLYMTHSFTNVHAHLTVFIHDLSFSNFWTTVLCLYCSVLSYYASFATLESVKSKWPLIFHTLSKAAIYFRSSSVPEIWSYRHFLLLLLVMVISVNTF